MMLSVQQIEAAIAQLPPNDVVELLSWLDQFHAHLWDKQIEEDLESGRLDSIIADVDAEYEAGLAQPL